MLQNKKCKHFLFYNDTICHLTLTELKDSILNCIKLIDNHICHCMVCKKTYKFKNLDTHKCYDKSKFIDIDINNKIKESSKKVSKKSSKKVSKKSSKKSSKKLSKKLSKKSSRIIK